MAKLSDDELKSLVKNGNYSTRFDELVSVTNNRIN